MSTQIQSIEQSIARHAPRMARVVEEVKRVIVGQDEVVQKLIVGLLADGHILVEGVPGLAKTTAVKALAHAVHASFKRLQFTPDLLPADLVGTQIYNPQDHSFSIKRGPIFANLILADEINRAPAKVQSALLEAMQERQVTIGEETMKLPVPFLVMATQNPIEQEGTYPLPEAQVDRFLLKVRIGYPTKADEIAIVHRMESGVEPTVSPVIETGEILAMRDTIHTIHMEEKLYGYITDIVFATREPGSYKLPDLKPLIQYGASPRASIYLARAARVMAFLSGRGYVTPQDVKSIAPDVLRHRVIISYEAEARDLTSEHIVGQILDKIDVP